MCKGLSLLGWHDSCYGVRNLTRPRQESDVLSNSPKCQNDDRKAISYVPRGMILARLVDSDCSKSWHDSCIKFMRYIVAMLRERGITNY